MAETSNNNSYKNNFEGGDHDTTSSDNDGYPNKRCKHVDDSVDVKRFKKKVSNMKPSDIKCVTCARGSRESSPPFTSTIDSVSSDDTPKESDSSFSKDAEILSRQSIQLCLTCGEPHCSRNDKGHALKHFEENKKHAISLSFDNSDTWCYVCDDDAVLPSVNEHHEVIDAMNIVQKIKEKDRDEEEEERGSFFKKKWKDSYSYQVTAPGLNNLGNTCFFNSVMQVVVGTSVLHDVLVPRSPYYDQPLLDVSKCVTAASDEVGPLTDAFKGFLNEMWRSRNTVVSPRELFSQISKKWQQFRGWRQQDSQELMRFLFDGIKSEELEHIKKLQLQYSHSLESDNSDDQNFDEEDLEDYEDSDKEKKDVKKFEPFIDACFGGNLVSVIVCDVCKKCSYSYEEFLDVSLPIKSSEDPYRFKFSSGYEYGNYSSYHGSGSYYNNNMSDHKSNDSSKSDNESEHGGEDTEQNEEVSSDTEKEEGIPVPSKETRKRIKLLLRDLPSDSGRSTPSSKDHVTLRDCLKSFVKVETLEGDNSFACVNCWELKKKYEEQKEKEETNLIGDETDDTGDTGDTGDSGDTGEIGKNQINGKSEDSQDTQDNNNMEDIVYNNGNTNDIDGTLHHLNKESDIEASSSSGLDNGNSSDTSDGSPRTAGNLDTDNSFLSLGDEHSMNSPTTVKPKPASEPERKYIFRKAYKRYLFDSLPPVMVFHLKRFQQVGSKWSVSMRKIDDFVAFDEELDIGDFVVPPEIEEKNEENGINNGHIIDNDNKESPSKQDKKPSTKYRLYGVVVHLGSLYNGHYIAYVLSRNIRGEGEQFGISDFSYDSDSKLRDIGQKHKTDDQRQWIYCSDSTVRSATVDDVLSSGAYLLFYERVDE